MKQIALALALTLPATALSADPMQFTALEGGSLNLRDYAGHVVVVVNTASFCAYTPQYEALQQLHDSDDGITVVGLPSDDFGGQEYGSEEEVAEFCEAMFGITFPMSDILHVRGTQAHEFFDWVGAQDVAGAQAQWNFHKWIIAPDGTLAGSLPTAITPDSTEMLAMIAQARNM